MSATYAPPSLGLAGGVTVEQFSQRRRLLAQFDRLRRAADVAGRFEGTDRLRGAAFQLLSNPQVARAFDLGREDPRLLRGQGRYFDDLKLADQLHAAIVRSPHAHADIRGIDAGAARAMPGVVAVLALDDLAPVLRQRRMVRVSNSGTSVGATCSDLSRS